MVTEIYRDGDECYIHVDCAEEKSEGWVSAAIPLADAKLWRGAQAPDEEAGGSLEDIFERLEEEKKEEAGGSLKDILKRLGREGGSSW